MEITSETSIVLLILLLAIIFLGYFFLKVLPNFLNRWLERKILNNSERIFWWRLSFGLSAAIFSLLTLDTILALAGDQSYIGAFLPISIPPNDLPALTAVRDGVAANIIFFLAVGIISARAAWTVPEHESIRNRVQMLFPRLKNLNSLIDPFVELALEQAAPTENIDIHIVIMEYSHAANAYKISIERRDQFINLLEREVFKSKNINVEINVDSLTAPNGILGAVTRANFVQLDLDGQKVAKKSYLPNGRPFEFIVASPVWASNQSNLEIPKAGKGVWKLEYWYWAKVGIPYTCKVRRPAQYCSITVSNQTNAAVNYFLITDAGPPVNGTFLPNSDVPLNWLRREAFPSLQLGLSP